MTTNDTTLDEGVYFDALEEDYLRVTLERDNLLAALKRIATKDCFPKEIAREAIAKFERSAR